MRLGEVYTRCRETTSICSVVRTEMRFLRYRTELRMTDNHDFRHQDGQKVVARKCSLFGVTTSVARFFAAKGDAKRRQFTGSSLGTEVWAHKPERTLRIFKENIQPQ